jgi:hypothetical protein
MFMGRMVSIYEERIRLAFVELIMTRLKKFPCPDPAEKTVFPLHFSMFATHHLRSTWAQGDSRTLVFKSELARYAFDM